MNSAGGLLRGAARRLAAALDSPLSRLRPPAAPHHPCGAALVRRVAPVVRRASVAWDLAFRQGRPQSAWSGRGEEWLEHDYHREVDEVLEVLQEEIEIFVEERDLPDSDVTYSQGVLNVVLGDLGTFVINKQTPNRQIWLSSPVSGPFRYDLVDGEWVYKHDGHRLVDKLSLEIGGLCDAQLELPF